MPSLAPSRTNDYAEGAHETRLADHLWLLLILLGAGVLYFGSAGSWGLWEPWETEYARMGRQLANSGLWMNPTDGAGNPVNKPWLTALLLEWGYRLSREPSMLLRVPFDAIFMLLAIPVYGLLRRKLDRAASLGLALSAGVVVVIIFYVLAFSTEFWLRAPFAALALLTVAGAYAVLSQYLGPHRAGAVAVVLATSPLFMLSGLSLAGAMPSIATTTLALCAFFMGVTSGRWIWWLLAGALTGLGVWADGVNGATIILGTIATFGLWSLWRTPGRLRAVTPIAVIVAVAVATLGYPAVQWMNEGFDASKETLGVFGPIGLALTLGAAGLFSDAFKRVGWRGVVAFLVPFAALVLVLVSQVRKLRGDDELFSFLLYNDFLSRRTLPDHVSFDTLIRQLGFAAYPYTVFLPLGLAYLFQTVRPEKTDPAARRSDDAGHGSVAALKAFGIAWFSVALMVIGLAATLSGQHIFNAMFPVALAVGLLLTDRGYWRGLRENRTALYLTGLGCLVVLLVLTKDLKTMANPELGQLGPEVLFEFLLHDGREAFPESFSLALVGLFRILFALGIALYFWLLLSWLHDLPDRLDRLTRRRALEPPASRLQAARRYALAPIRAAFRALGVAIAAALRPLRGVFNAGRKVVEEPLAFASIAIGGCVVFAALTAAAYMPQLSHHLSNRGLIETYNVIAEPGEILYRVGAGSTAATNYYLGEETVTIATGDENPIETLRTVSQLRPFFCDSDERMFAIINRDSLAAAYYEVRHEETRREGECDPDRDLFVLDARSSRYVLLSNQLKDGETDEDPIAEHVFEELPDDAIRMTTEPTFDGKIQLIGYRVLNEEGEVISTAETRQDIYLETFFEVLDRVPSAREMFIHIDYRNSRINGDHDPVDGMFPLNYWVPGEIVRDRFKLTVDPGSATGDYTIYIGFFSGDSRMQVRPPTGDNRVNVGMIHIEGGI